MGFPELAGAAMLAGAVVLVTAVLGLTDRLAGWIPVPIVQGLIAGAVLPFVVGIFSALSTADDRRTGRGADHGGAAPSWRYLLGHAVLGARFPPILPAFLAGLAVAVATGQLGRSPWSSRSALDLVTPDVLVDGDRDRRPRCSSRS